MKNIIKKPEKVFLIFGILFVSISIFTMPIFKVPDENNHARMTWGILHERKEDSYDWMKFGKFDSVALNKAEYKEWFTKKVDFSQEKMRISLPVNEIMHLPQLIGMMIGKLIYPSVGVIITLGRITNALFYIILMFFIIKYLRYGKEALVFISLLPIMIQQVGSLSYDVMNFIAIFSFFLILSNLSVDKILTKKWVVLLVLSVFGLAITKLNNLLLILLLFPLNLRLSEKYRTINNSLESLETFVKKKKGILFSGGLLTVLILATLYLNSKGGILNLMQVFMNTLLDSNLNEHLNGILTVGMFGALGPFEFQIPLWVVMIDIFVLSILLIKNEKYSLNKDFGIMSGLVLPLQVLVIVGGMYFAWTPIVLGEGALISQGAQGRYFTPFILFLVPLFISYKDKLTIVYNKNTLNKLYIITIAFNFLIMLYLIVLNYWLPGVQADWLLDLRKAIGI